MAKLEGMTNDHIMKSGHEALSAFVILFVICHSCVVISNVQVSDV
jgi:hypothetical protein